MSRLPEKVERYLEFVSDLLWASPWGTTVSDDELQSTELAALRSKAESVTESNLESFEKVLIRTLESEKARRQSLDARLTSLAGISSGGAALMLAVAGNANLLAPDDTREILVLCLICYDLVQLCCVTYNAVHGLYLSHVRDFSSVELLRGGTTGAVQHAKALAERYQECRYSLIRVCNAKGTRLQCAYVGLRNVAVATASGCTMFLLYTILS